jgi:hypothetical protein
MTDSVKDSKRLPEANEESRLESDEIAQRMEVGLRRAFRMPPKNKEKAPPKEESAKRGSA